MSALRKEEQDEFEGFWLEGDSLAPPCQSEDDVIEAILDLAGEHWQQAKSGASSTSPSSSSSSSSAAVSSAPPRVLMDLGCGDGRICIAATRRFGCRSVGCEVEDCLVERMKKAIESGNLQDRVSIVHGDLRELDLSEAGVIVVYLLTESVQEIKQKLVDAIRGGAIVICNTWGMKGSDVKPAKRVYCGYNNNTTLILYDGSSLQDEA